MLNYIDETRMSRKFNVKVRSFPGAKPDMFHYSVPLLEKNPDYIILHVGTNNAVDHQSNEVWKKVWQKTPSVVDDVIQQLQQLNTEMINNVNIEKNMLGKKGLQLNRNGIEQFPNNLIDAFRKF